jgi:hypothetical protein
MAVTATYTAFENDTNQVARYSVGPVHHHRNLVNGRRTRVRARNGSQASSLLAVAGYQHDASGRRKWLSLGGTGPRIATFKQQ